MARSAASLEPVTQEIHAINKNIKVLAVEADLKSVKSITALWEEIKSTFGHADVLIKNAASNYTGPLAEAPADGWWNDFVRLVSPKKIR